MSRVRLWTRGAACALAALLSLAPTGLARQVSSQDAPSDSPQGRPAAPASRALVGEAASGLTPVEVRLHQVAADIERAVRDSDAQAAEAAADDERFFRDVIAGLELTLMDRVALRREIGVFYKQLLSYSLPLETADGGSYEFLRIVVRPAGPAGLPQRRLLFRNVGHDGVNYHEHILDDRPARGAGPARVVDTYVLMGDMTLSATMRELLLDGQRAIRQAGQMSAEMLLLEEMNRALAVGDAEAALAAFDRAPAEARAGRVARMSRLRAASALTAVTGDTAPLVAAIEDYRQVIDPATAAGALLLLDLHVSAGQWDEAEAAVARLDAWTGGDPFLNYSRAVIQHGRGRLEEARASCDATARALPHLPHGYDMRVVVAADQKDYDQVLADLRMLRDGFGWVYDDITAQPALQGFIGSPQFAQWRADRPQDWVAD